MYASRAVPLAALLPLSMSGPGCAANLIAAAAAGGGHRHRRGPTRVGRAGGGTLVGVVHAVAALAVW
jgi:hypothetical protein